MNSRSFVAVGLTAFFVGGVAGCKKDEAPTPDPAAVSSSSETSSRVRLGAHNALGLMPRIDPQALKDYRVDACYYGTLSLKQTRDAYLASLGKDEPSDKKLPSFGVTSVAPPATSAAAGAGAKAAPVVAPGVKPAPVVPAHVGVAPGKPGVTGPGSLADHRFEIRPPHERNARFCPVAAGLKEPAMGDVDVAIAAYSPFVVELTRDLTTASMYYQREEFKKDAFAKGKELHKKLVDEFQKLDDLQDKLGVALAAWQKEHPADLSKMDEGEKAALPPFEDARAVLLAAAAKKVDPEAYKASVAKLVKSTDEFKKFGADHSADAWAKIMQAPLDAFIKAAQDVKVSAAGTVDGDGFLAVVTSFANLIEGRQRSISRAMVAKNQAAPPAQVPPPVSSAVPAP